jgi:thiol-disulfide isomerase/thioredoxin
MREHIAFRGLAGLLLAAILAVYAIAASRDNAAASAVTAGNPYKRLEWHETPVALPAQGFVGPDGAALTLAAFKGRTILLNLWASWCRPCVEEMPALARLQKDLGGPDFTVVAVSLDMNPEDGRAWLAANHLEALPFHFDPKGRLYDALKAPGLPVSIFIDKEGREVGRVAGSIPWDEPKARALIARAQGGSVQR